MNTFFGMTININIFIILYKRIKERSKTNKIIEINTHLSITFNLMLVDQSENRLAD